ncbi:YaeQ family protein [Microbulbifer spongiae]|uniref:YaeQ family protein n=1 Tax=Microbulbifer spongiae TaxID=2944933 RepID=A0ABY9EGW1_9GAMM|nr:YaeQ family protein [Microbulbifer sp. MI-G]WKD50879.1 YaeQ family protein [Microbulbifer sp. MI-G]
MALKATIFKTNVQIADLDRDYYARHQLTLARHPSETDVRMMVRLLAFVHNATASLTFTRGLSSVEDADLWQKSPSGDIDLWIEVGLPAAERLRKASNRAGRVLVYSFGGRAALVWWRKLGSQLAHFDKLEVFHLSAHSTAQLADMVERTMNFSITIQDGHFCFAARDHSVELSLEIWKQEQRS